MDFKGLRELLMENRNGGLRLEELQPSETVYKAIIVRDFMRENGVEDVRQGIRKFFSFQRERLKQLGFVPETTPSCKNYRPLPTSVDHVPVAGFRRK